MFIGEFSPFPYIVIIDKYGLTIFILLSSGCLVFYLLHSFLALFLLDVMIFCRGMASLPSINLFVYLRKAFAFGYQEAYIRHPSQQDSAQREPSESPISQSFPERGLFAYFKAAV